MRNYALWTEKLFVQQTFAFMFIHMFTNSSPLLPRYRIETRKRKNVSATNA